MFNKQGFLVALSLMVAVSNAQAFTQVKVATTTATQVAKAVELMSQEAVASSAQLEQRLVALSVAEAGAEAKSIAGLFGVLNPIAQAMKASGQATSANFEKLAALAEENSLDRDAMIEALESSNGSVDAALASLEAKRGDINYMTQAAIEKLDAYEVGQQLVASGSRELRSLRRKGQLSADMYKSLGRIQMAAAVAADASCTNKQCQVMFQGYPELVARSGYLKHGPRAEEFITELVLSRAIYTQGDTNFLTQKLAGEIEEGHTLDACHIDHTAVGADS